MGVARESTPRPTLTGSRMHCICFVTKRLTYKYTPSHSVPLICRTYVNRGSWEPMLFLHILTWRKTTRVRRRRPGSVPQVKRVVKHSGSPLTSESVCLYTGLRPCFFDADAIYLRFEVENFYYIYQCKSAAEAMVHIYLGLEHVSQRARGLRKSQLPYQALVEED